MAKVTVFPFKMFNIIDGNFKESPSYATLETIQRIGGAVIEGSAIEIDEDMLDGNGMYKPKGMTASRIEILYRAQADTDYTIAYIDGRPAAISEQRSGGHYAFIENREYIYNRSAGQCWYVNDGKWQSTESARSFAQQNIVIDVAVSYTRREVNDGSQKVYDGGLEEAFGD